MSNVNLLLILKISCNNNYQNSTNGTTTGEVMCQLNNLTWNMPNAFSRHFEIKNNTQLLGTLSFKSSFGSLAFAEFNNCKWTFKRVGVFNPSITIMQVNSTSLMAIYKPSSISGTGTINFNDGKYYNWNNANFWNTRFVLTDKSNKILLHYNFETNFGLLNQQSIVSVTDEGKNNEHIGLLICFTYYVLVLMHNQVMEAGAAVIM